MMRVSFSSSHRHHDPIEAVAMQDEQEYYDDDDEDDHNDLAPLVGTGSSSNTFALEIDDFRRRRHRHYHGSKSLTQTVLDNCKVLVLILAFCVIVSIPLLVSRKLDSDGYERSHVVYEPLKKCDGNNASRFEELMDTERATDQHCHPDLVVLECSDYQKSDNCPCQSSVEGHAMENDEKYPTSGDRWAASFARQQEQVAIYLKNHGDDDRSLDVVILGDSISEHWLGTDLGDSCEEYLDVKPIYKSLFTKKGGGKLDAMVLAIAGERTWHILYRLQHGALSGGGASIQRQDGHAAPPPPMLHPNIFWLAVGTNNLGGDCCSTENVVAGHIAIIQELKELRPDATIVINSILPRGTDFMPFIDPINRQLECFASQTDGVEFFDATDLFVVKNENTKTMIRDYYYVDDGLHPNAQGHQVWGEAMVDKMLEILARSSDKNNQ